jgi:hypothetical protein
MVFIDTQAGTTQPSSASGALSSLDFILPSCEPTAHRGVRNIMLPPPHPHHEWRLQPSLAPWRSGGRLATTEADRFRSRSWRSPATGGQPRDFPANPGKPAWGGYSCGGTPVAPQQRRYPLPPRPSPGSADSNLHDVMSVQQAESSTMSCRKKLYDDLSVRTFPSLSGIHPPEAIASEFAGCSGSRP